MIYSVPGSEPLILLSIDLELTVKPKAFYILLLQFIAEFAKK